MKRPNVILLITHDTGRFVSPYGVKTVDTPNFERLASESVVFEKAFCTAPQCSPSRSSIVTGRYPHSNGVMGLAQTGFEWSLNPDEQPAAKIFGPAGYTTWLLGHQHETHDPRSLGFDHVDIDFNLPQLPDHLEPLLKARDPDRPFYCQIGCIETHRNWEATWTDENIPPDDALGITVPPYLHDGPATRKELAGFQGMVKHTDHHLGRLLNLLDEHNLRDDTILVVTTDHGIAMPMAKGTLRDPGLETMLFIRAPGKEHGAGRRVAELVSNIDLLPTLLDACGIQIPDRIQGKSLLPFLHAKAKGTRDVLFAERTFHDCYDPMRCVRTEQFKYIRYFEKTSYHTVPGDIVNEGACRELGREWRFHYEELYDLQADPDEKNNLATDESHAATLRDMQVRLAEWMRDTQDPLLDGPIASSYYRDRIRELKDLL